MERHAAALETGIGGTLFCLHLLMQPAQAEAQSIGEAITLSVGATVLPSVSISADGEVSGDGAQQDQVAREAIVVVY